VCSDSILELANKLVIFIGTSTSSSSSSPESTAKEKESRYLDLLIYSMATLKNTSNDEQAQKRIIGSSVGLSAGGIKIFTQIIQISIKASSIPRPAVPTTNNGNGKEDNYLQRYTQLLIQTTAILRNLASNLTPTSTTFQDTKLVQSLLQLLHDSSFNSSATSNNLHSEDASEESISNDGWFSYTDSPELMLNVARVCSKLSLHPKCLEMLNGKENIEDMIHLIVKYQYAKVSKMTHFINYLWLFSFHVCFIDDHSF
jgi:hypothetical protein